MKVSRTYTRKRYKAKRVDVKRNSKWQWNISLELLRTFFQNTPACNCCGHAFVYCNPNHSRYPSFDRIDSKRGYECDNVQLLCRKCNSKKGNMSVLYPFKPHPAAHGLWLNHLTDDLILVF